MTAPYQDDFSLIDLVLAQQRDMTAVERFSNFHDKAHSSSPNYRHLIPLSRPNPGEQYAFLVDLDRCSGCKACVSACHSLNGLEEGETWRTAGTVVGEDSPYLQTVTASCHHCVDPACAAGCPVLAYEKDAVTGIVRHLDDQCMGCQYCVLKCPYDVPKYSRTKGIVRKCDMCHGRLAVGEAPACVQACPHEAIRIEIVGQNDMRTESCVPGSQIIPGAFPSAYTVPTTRYRSEKKIPTLTDNSSHIQHREHAHWPLIAMLLLTQTALGLHLCARTLQFTGNTGPIHSLVNAAAGFLVFGLAASIFHLGRPLKAWRAFLGWRRSWMSREILAFGAYTTASLALIFAPHAGLLSNATCLVGMLSVACSAMIYVDTRRPGWTPGIVSSRFLASTIGLGSATAALLSVPSSPALTKAFVMCAMAAVLVRIFRSEQRSQVGFYSLAVGSAILCLAYNAAMPWVIFTFFSTVAAHLSERWHFFVDTPAPRMPGALPA